MEFLTVNELSILRWIHILAMVYWLGGEWGVFQTSYNITNRNLSLDERKRHMETAYRIDILARTGIVLLEEKLRYPLILALFVVSFMAFQDSGPIEAGEGSRWYPSKIGLYAFALCIGLFLRLVMRRWTERFRILAQGPDAAQEAALEREIAQARFAAYIYWITISGVCFLGAVKPF